MCAPKKLMFLITMEFVMLSVMGCAREALPRARTPAFKGMELYSWKPAGQDWHFSLLPGTNRLKKMSEITAPEKTLSGVRELEKRLSRLAVGESVSWDNLADEPVPQEMQAELKALGEELQIRLGPCVWIPPSQRHIYQEGK